MALIAPAAGILDLRTHPVELLLLVALLVMSVSVHEAAHAWAAWRCGDSTARDLGRLSLNPIVHIDPLMSIVVPALALLVGGFFFGGAKPVPVAFHRLRHPWRDMSFVAFAGPLSNLLLAIVFALLFAMFLSTGWYNDAATSPHERVDDLLPRLMFSAVNLNVLLFVFNLLPIPPLDGSRIMAWILPQSVRDAYLAIEPYGLYVVFALVIWGPLNGPLREARHFVLRLISDMLVALGVF